MDRRSFLALTTAGFAAMPGTMLFAGGHGRLGSFQGLSRHTTTGTAEIAGDRVNLLADFTFDGAPDPKDGSAPSATPQGASAVISGPPATPRRLGDGGPPAVVHVFSGPDNRVDGLAAYLSKLGVPCVDLDIVKFRQGEIKSSHDLSSDSLWETLRSELEGARVLALWFGIPCSTFSKARGHGSGPRPLRSVHHIYQSGIPAHPGSF